MDAISIEVWTLLNYRDVVLYANYVQHSTVWYMLQIGSGNLPPDAALRARTARVYRMLDSAPLDYILPLSVI